MLVLGINIGKERYGISTDSIIEIVPLITLNKIPLSEKSIKGIFNYRGDPTLVIDLCQLFENRYCDSTLSSRIIIINYNTYKIGLVAENVTDVIRYDKVKESKDPIKQNDENTLQKKFLGDIFQHDDELIQLINTQHILPDSINQQILEQIN